MLHPHSRGSVHIQSTHSLKPQCIDPNLFRESIDLDFLVQGIKLARRLASEHPFSAYIVQELYPGLNVQTDMQLKEYARRFGGMSFNPVGTAAMAPREYMGVVSPDLLVYGTINLRVVWRSYLISEGVFV